VHFQFYDLVNTGNRAIELFKPAYHTVEKQKGNLTYSVTVMKKYSCFYCLAFWFDFGDSVGGCVYLSLSSVHMYMTVVVDFVLENL